MHNSLPQVLLLSAGLGTRLRPLTNSIPKPLVPVRGKTLLERNLEVIARSGGKEVIINLHYLGEQIRSFVGDGARWGLEVSYSEEPVLLDTGGAMRGIEDRLKGQSFISFNSDILVADDFDLSDLYRAHTDNSRQPEITMALREDPAAESFGSLEIDPDGKVIGFLGTPYGEQAANRKKLMYLGVMVLNSSVLQYMPPKGEIFSITRHILPKILSRAIGHPTGGVYAWEYSGPWSDVGTPERLELASKIL